MKLLVFEYSSVCLESSLLSEGFNMLKSILDDLDNYPFFEIDYLINKSITNLKYNSCNAVHLDEDLHNWLRNNCSDYEYCIFIAPEDDFIQFTITKILEDNGVYIIGCDSSSSYTCTSKYLTYAKMQEDILKINTIKMDIKDINYEIICEILNNNNFIIKPDNRTSTNLIYHIKNKEELNEVLKIYTQNLLKEAIIQEFIHGEALSVSLICNKNNIKCISINYQKISLKNNKIKFCGCISPIEHPLKEELYDISEKIIKCIPGLKGFVGIDYLIKEDKIYFVEINSRITTPFIVLQRNCRENLTQSIIEFVLYDSPLNLTFKKKGTFEVSD